MSQISKIKFSDLRKDFIETLKFSSLFKYRKINLDIQQEGVKPIVITIDGFLNRDSSRYEDWRMVVGKKFSLNAWNHLGWDSGSVNELIYEKLLKIADFGFQIYYMKGLGYILGTRRSKAYKYLDREWAWLAAKRKSKMAGKELANYIKKNEHKKFILIGHSLGTNLIKHCLINLSKDDFNNISEVYLLGGATENKEIEWVQASACVQKKIYNYYSHNDLVLKAAYPFVSKSNHYSPIGLSEIKVNKVQNFDVSEMVSGHGEFVKNFHLFIK